MQSAWRLAAENVGDCWGATISWMGKAAGIYGGFLSHGGTPTTSIYRWFFPNKNHPFWGTPIYGNLHMFGNIN